ncbi:peroxiredoxin [Aliikangiella sp. G2MR2-5]|uniref:peroxiredoxin family protein n=1 Tax=Aliikangiella sp. G2MR2-5 TaxID=2788943 RepID=UPI0018ABBF24|nr:TlpA disulfide reductase family protein [Aliikangiella sp. G2MR2-5]
MNTQNKSKRLKSISSWILQALVLIIIFVIITWWQQKEMLSSNESLPAPSFVLPSLAGDTVSFPAMDSKGKTLLYFFAPWCRVCHLSVGNLQDVYERNSDKDLSIYLIALDWKEQNQIDDFVRQHSLTIPVLLGTDKISNAYKIQGFPSYYLISEENKIIAKDMGYSTEAGIIIRLLAN